MSLKKKPSPHWDFVERVSARERDARASMDTQHWGVTVYRNGDQVVTIEKAMLTGRDLSEADRQVIRMAANHLLAFLGELAPTPSPVEEGQKHG